MLHWRHFFKREVFIPASILVLAGFSLAWLGRQLAPLLADSGFRWLAWTFWLSVLVFLLFAYVTLRHILSTYTLERFDPGDPASVRRLSNLSRFNYPPPDHPFNPYLPVLEQAFLLSGFQPEANHPVIGRVLLRTRPSRLPGLLPDRRERIFIVEKTPLNVFIVDFAIRDTLRYLADQIHEPSDHNLLLFITHEPQLLEAASAAAGVVNFLGKTEEGIIGALLLDAANNRLYHPIDETLLPFTQRWYFRRQRRTLLDAVQMAGNAPSPESDNTPSPESGQTPGTKPVPPPDQTGDQPL